MCTSPHIPADLAFVDERCCCCSCCCSTAAAPATLMRLELGSLQACSVNDTIMTPCVERERTSQTSYPSSCIETVQPCARPSLRHNEGCSKPKASGQMHQAEICEAIDQMSIMHACICSPPRSDLKPCAVQPHTRPHDPCVVSKMMAQWEQHIN